MKHYDELRKELDELQQTQVYSSRNGRQTASDIRAFNLPASIVLIAIKYALKSAWSDEDRQQIKEAVLKLYDDLIVPINLPAVNGHAEKFVEKIARGMLSAILDLAL